ncbi:MAG: hypothetical protein J0M16_12400, partial [Gammaproteobacteria bacterium]|nr:hypothetical protein [Gammaproteobacteria bacterium]
MSAVRAAVTAAVVLMVLGALGLVAVATPGGSAWIVATLADLAGERLVVTGVSGTLLEGLAVERLQLTAGRVTLVVEPAALAMSWPDLLRRRLRLATARAESVRIDIAPRPPDDPDKPVEPLLLPVAIVAEGLEVGSLVIRNGLAPDGQAGSTIAIGPVVFRGALVDGVVRIGSLRVEGYGLVAGAQGTFGTGEPFATDVTVDWLTASPGPAGTPVRGSGRLSGDLAALRVEQVVRLPSPVAVGGLARLLGADPVVFAEARWR